ncbi:MAG: c-type cytochrome [Marinobacter sp.]|nr:c-type cytochrome [Marinobacter sp.]
MNRPPSAPRHLHLPAVIGLVALLTACSDTPPDPASLQAYARQAMPEEAALAATYTRSCQACHATGTSRAPLTGDTQAWGRLLNKGMDTLVNNTIQGFGGMPPMGLCMDCDREDFAALIRFMASEPKQPGGSS